MVLSRFFGKEKEQTPEWKEPTLETMAPGFLVDFDLKTWEVIARAAYDYDGSKSKEWTLRSGDAVRFLEGYEEDGRLHWTLTEALAWDKLDEQIGRDIAEKGDPPEIVHCNGIQYEAVESSAGLYRKGDDESEREFVSWSFGAAGGAVLFISQWGERDFSAFVGNEVEAYQFSNILPAVKE